LDAKFSKDEFIIENELLGSAILGPNDSLVVGVEGKLRIANGELLDLPSLVIAYE
jgi:hypothetical protein